MNTKKIISYILPGLFLIIISCGKKSNPVQDYLNTGDVITFDNARYNLAWSSHPSENYYKQEYLPEGDTIEKFRRLILLEAVTGKPQLKDAVDSKTSELKKMKETDPMVNYEVFEKDGEVMLDFLVSKNMSDLNEGDIAERNVYRYKTFTDSNGEEGVLLFGVSERAYGDDIDRFLLTLREKRFDVPNAAGAFVIPKVTINK